MSYIIRDENGGERVIAPWRGVDPLGERAELIRTIGGGGRKGLLGLGGRYPTWEHTYDTDTGITTIDTEGYGTTRYRDVTDPETGFIRSEILPSFSSPMLSKEETNAKKWGLLNSFVDMIKRTGGNLLDRYQQNEAEKREWRENNPGGYPGMPQHLRERLRRNQMSSIDGQLVAGYDPELDQHLYDEHGPVVGTPSQEFLDRPKIFGSDVLDMLIENEQVKNLSRSNNGWA